MACRQSSPQESESLLVAAACEVFPHTYIVSYLDAGARLMDHEYRPDLTMKGMEM